MSALIARLNAFGWRTLTAVLLACASSSSLAVTDEIGRLFYTPAQRAQLEAMRAHGPRTPGSGHARTVDDDIPPLRFDGMVTRSDGKTTRWIDGKAQVGPSSVSGLKPGQIRANGKVYEPYQVLRPTPDVPSEPSEKGATP